MFDSILCNQLKGVPEGSPQFTIARQYLPPQMALMFIYWANTVGTPYNTVQYDIEALT